MDFREVSHEIGQGTYTSEQIRQIADVPRFEKDDSAAGSHVLETTVGLSRFLTHIHGIEDAEEEKRLRSSEKMYEINPFLPTIGIELEVDGKYIPYAVESFFAEIGWPIVKSSEGSYVEISPPPGFSPRTINRLLSYFIRLGFVKCAMDDNRKVRSITEYPIPSLHVNVGVSRQILDISNKKTPIGLSITEICPLVSSLDQLMHGNPERIRQKKINKDSRLIRPGGRAISIIKETDSGILVPYDSRTEYSMPGLYDYRTYRSVMNIYDLHSLLLSVGLNLLPSNVREKLVEESLIMIDRIKRSPIGMELMDNLDPADSFITERRFILLECMWEIDLRRQIYSIVQNFKRRTRHLIGLPNVREL